MLFMKKKAVTLLATATALVGLAATPALANPPSPVPGLARNVALAVNGPLATLSWSAPADTGSSAITGYTDASVSGAAATRQCMARASAVANYLTSIIPAGLPNKPRFIAVSGGATNRWDKKNPAGNRRVDFSVVPV